MYRPEKTSHRRICTFGSSFFKESAPARVILLKGAAICARLASGQVLQPVVTHRRVHQRQLAQRSEFLQVRHAGRRDLRVGQLQLDEAGHPGEVFQRLVVGGSVGEVELSQLRLRHSSKSLAGDRRPARLSDCRRGIFSRQARPSVGDLRPGQRQASAAGSRHQLWRRLVVSCGAFQIEHHQPRQVRQAVRRPCRRPS